MRATKCLELATTPTEVKLLSFCLIHAQRVFLDIHYVRRQPHGRFYSKDLLEISIGSFDKNYLSTIVYVFR